MLVEEVVMALLVVVLRVVDKFWLEVLDPVWLEDPTVVLLAVAVAGGREPEGEP